MAKLRFDGVVEAVHYTPEGSVDWVRAYLRRGSIFSDRVMLDRQGLVEQLRSGKRFMVGKPRQYLASTFETTKPVKLIEQNGGSFLTAGGAQKDRDYLEGVPIL